MRLEVQLKILNVFLKVMTLCSLMGTHVLMDPLATKIYGEDDVAGF
jgi:hypothetical protein